MPQNFVEKIAQKFAEGLSAGQIVRSGDFISISPAHVMTHDNTGAVIKKFKSIGASKMANPEQPVFTLDHNIQDRSPENMKKYQAIEAFAVEMGVDFYPAGRGIGHQIMCEEGYAWPGTMVVASDSHSNMYGGLGCLGTPIVRTDAAALWATGRTWWKVPPVAKVELHGELQAGVSGKDVIICLCGMFCHDEVLNYAIEFAGDGISQLNAEQRLTIANMTTEWGALAGIFPVDAVTIAWLRQRCEYVEQRGAAGVPSHRQGLHPRLNKHRLAQLEANKPAADAGACYSKILRLDLATVTPHISGPNHVKVMNSARELSAQNIKIDKAYLVSCVNSRVEDLSQAAAVIKGQKVASGVKFYIAAASSEVQAESERRGDWQALLDAGAIMLPPGCGPCIGLGEGLLEDGEVGISATNRNFKGRMGSRDAQAYLASPAVVAASAVAGKIALPRQFAEVQPQIESREPDSENQASPEITLLAGFSATMRGEIIFCHQDNLNTDGIYPGKYTYIDDFTPQQQAQVVMENYDPEFTNLVRSGDILVGGYNFGTGSSREQAATALKYCGICLVIAGSFSDTYQRNAFNNGFLLLTAPKLVQELKKRYGNEKLSVRTQLEAEIDFRQSMIRVAGENYPMSPIGQAAQELILAGGLEEWVKKRLLG